MTKNTALLIMDLQVNFIELVTGPKDFVDCTNAAISAAHAANIPVIYVIAGFRKDCTDLSENNKMHSMLKSLPFSLEKPEVHPLISKKPDDIVVTKKRASAFSGSDLQVILRAMKVEKLVLCGLATGGVVLTTVTEGADLDYEIVVLSDCCADLEPEVHTFLVNKIFPRHGTVLTAKEWAGGIASQK